MKNENKIKVEIATIEGHTELMLDRQETEEVIQEILDREKGLQWWVFADNIMVAREHVAALDFDNITQLRLMPALIGGAINSETDALGEFHIFKEDRIPGHNQSLLWLNQMCKEVDAKVDSIRAHYNEETYIQIETEGKSGTIYRIEIKFNYSYAHKLSEKLTLDKYEIGKGDIGICLKQLKLFDFKVCGYRFSKPCWENICIEPVQETEHDADSISALLLALENDIESAKIIEMHTLRNFLIENILTNWIFHPRPFMSFEEVSLFVKNLISMIPKSERRNGYNDLFT